VTQMCEKDGGVHVYETVKLSEEEYGLYVNQFGKLSIPREDEASESIQYVRNDNRKFIRKNNPTVSRFEFVIKKRKDNKVLGKRISYSRVGGDFQVIIGHPSIYTCPAKINSLFNAIILKREGE